MGGLEGVTDAATGQVKGDGHEDVAAMVDGEEHDV